MSLGRAGASSTPHVASLDGLRGLAVVLVIWYHLWEISWLPADVNLGFMRANFNVFPETGSAGVDLFFFISGFCLFYPYARTMFDGAPLQSVATFAYRRVLKIVPSYYLAMLLLIAFGFTHFDSTANAARQIVAHLTFVQNLWPQTWGGIDGVMWSLATEVQFYVVFPLLCWCAMRRPLVTFAVLLAVGNAYRFLVAHDAGGFYEIDRLPGTIDLFAAGMLSAWLYRAIAVRRPALAGRRWVWSAVAIAGASACYLAMQYQFAHRYDPHWDTQWKVTFRPTFEAGLVPLTVGSLFAFVWWRRLLANRALVFLSYISYNLYLWHQPLAQAIFDHRLLPYVGQSPKSDNAWGLTFTVFSFVAAVAVAWTITALVEQPILRRKGLRFAPRVRLSEG